MPLKCDVSNWFTGTFNDVQFFNATVPGAVTIAMQMAQMAAAGKAVSKILNLYGMPCPVGCAGKTGLYSLDITFEFKKLPKGMSVKCNVAWLLVIDCDAERQSQPVPVLEEWKKLHRLYGKTAA